MTTTSISTRRWKSWAVDAAERALRSLAVATVAALPTSDAGIGIEAFFEWEPWSIGLGAAALDLLVSLGAKRRGNPSNASTLSE